MVLKHSSHKKPAMALVLIIIIITSISVVIMGTIKLIANTSGDYSINRNARGYIKSKNPLGQYLCYIVPVLTSAGTYKYKMFQARVEYNSDGTVNPGDVSPKNDGQPYIVGGGDGPCEFRIPDNYDHLNITLIGGGAGGSISSYISRKYFYNPTTSTDIFNKYDLRVSMRIEQGTNETEDDYFHFTSPELFEGSFQELKDKENRIELNTISAQYSIPCCRVPAPGGATNLSQCSVQDCDRKPKVTISNSNKKYVLELIENHNTVVGSYDITYNENEDSLFQYLVKPLNTDDDQTNLVNAIKDYIKNNFNNCTFESKYVYQSAEHIPPPDKVKQFTITKADIEFNLGEGENTIKIDGKPNENINCKNCTAKLCAHIGEGGEYDTELRRGQIGGVTCFAYKDGDKKIINTSYITDPSKIPSGFKSSEYDKDDDFKGNKNQPGLEPEFRIPSTFKTPFDSSAPANAKYITLHPGYVRPDFKNPEDGSTYGDVLIGKYIAPATMFGSSGPLLVPSDPPNAQCQGEVTVQKNISGSSCKNHIPAPKECYSRINEQAVKDLLRGGYGAIMIEW